MTDIEQLVIGWIAGSTQYRVATQRPNPAPEEMITVERTGGNYDAYYHVQSPVVAVQCWAKTAGRAKAMAYDVATAITDIDHGPRVQKLGVDGMYYFPSEDDLPRYQIIISFNYQED